MAAQLGSVHWHDHDVACPGGDDLVAAGAAVGLGRLVGLDPSHLHRLLAVWRMGAQVHPGNLEAERAEAGIEEPAAVRLVHVGVERSEV